MKNIINFKNDRDFIKYLSRHGVFANLISKSNNGSTYLSRKENLVYKAFYGRMYEYVPEEIIMADDILLDSFVFPEELFCIDDVLKGYVCEFIENNLMPNFNNDFSLKILEKIDFDSMIRSYYNLVVDAYRLSNQGIMMSNGTNNLLFDNQRFSFINTYSYKSVEEDPSEINQKVIKEAITTPIDLALREYDINLSSKYKDIELYLKEVERIVNEEKIKSKVYHY